MEHNDKIQQLLDMQDHLHEISDEQLNEALQEKGLKELAEHLAKAKGELLAHDYSDHHSLADAAWDEFEQQHFASRGHQRRWWQMAAMVAGILFLSGLTFAAIHYGYNSKSSTTAQSEQIKCTKQPANKVNAPEAIITVSDSLKYEAVTFDNKPLAQIVERMASFYQVEVVIENNDAHTLRFYYVWHPGDDLDQAIEKLNNFEHVEIVLDNQKLIVK